MHNQTAYSNLATTAAATALKPPVQAGIEAMDATANRLHDRISLLEQRLAPILSPLPPQPVGETAGKLARHSLALQIEAGCMSIGGAADRVDSIINRLEL